MSSKMRNAPPRNNNNKAEPEAKNAKNGEKTVSEEWEKKRKQKNTVKIIHNYAPDNFKLNCHFYTETL